MKPISPTLARITLSALSSAAREADARATKAASQGRRKAAEVEVLKLERMVRMMACVDGVVETRR